MKSGQKGFAAVEALLVLILISIVGFTGYYVYHTKKSTNSTYNKAAQTAASTPPGSSASTGKFIFKEIGVQILLPASLKDLRYSVFSTDSGSPNLALSTPEFTSLLNKCDPSTTEQKNPAFIVISKVPGQYSQDSYPGTGNLKQFKDFWISAASPNGIVCTGSVSEQELTNALKADTAALTTAFKTATLVK